MTGWTNSTILKDVDLKSITTGPGTYIISTGRPIARVIEIDPEGIIDIGESGRLRQRVREFVRSATEPGREGHMAGWRYAFFRFDRHFPFDELRIRWCTVETKAEAYEIEGRTMLAYLTKHAELPPLNYSFNWSPFKADGWDLFDRMLADGD